MIDKIASSSADPSFNVSPARSEMRTRQRGCKRSQRSIKEQNMISLSCSKDAEANKLHKRLRGSPEIVKKHQNQLNLEIGHLLQTSSQNDLCERCSNEPCMCLPKLMKKQNEKKNTGTIQNGLTSNLLIKINPVYLLQSIYQGRPATVLFDYPKQCQKPSRKDPSRVIELIDDVEGKRMYFKISDSVHTYNCLVNALAHAGFTQVSNSMYNIKISGVPKPKLLRKFNQYQKTNHFPGI